MAVALDQVIEGRRLQPQRDFGKLLRLSAICVAMKHHRDPANPQDDDEDGDEYSGSGIHPYKTIVTP
jgi:hypothetical protein